MLLIEFLHQLRHQERVNQPLNLLTRLNRFVRVIEERANRGATQVRLHFAIV